MTSADGYIHGTDSSEQARLTRMQDLLNGGSLRELGLRPGDRVLDVGSGLAHFARAMGRAVGPDGRVVGVEANAAQLQEARRVAERDGEEDLVDLRHGLATELPLADDEWGTFDVVHARFLLEHVTDPAAVVRQMVAAARPGGRIVLEDDDHEDLRLHPEPPGVLEVWGAYIQAYERLGADPLVGRHLVSLLHDAGAEPFRSQCLSFGGCRGEPSFPLLVDNFIGVIQTARHVMLREGLLDEATLDAGLSSFASWAERPDASLWYATSWAEGRRPGGEDGGRGAAARSATTSGSGAKAGAKSGAADAAPVTVSVSDGLPLDEVDALRLLLDTAEDLNSTLEQREVLGRVARRVRGLVPCDLFCVLLWDEDAQILQHSFSMRFDEHVELGTQGGFPLGKGIGGSAAAARQVVRVPDVREDPRYVRFRHAEVEIRSEMAVPLIVRGELVGVVDLESVHLDAFTEEHERLMRLLASRIANALVNARLYEEVRGHEQRIQLELDIARDIQDALLDDNTPQVRGLEVGWAYAPAGDLGGDVIDFLPHGADRLTLVVGDVAGKGTPAALYGALALGVLRSEFLEGVTDPGTLFAGLGRQLCRPHLEDRFLAAAAVLYDPDDPSVTLVNSGLPRPILVRDGKAQWLPPGGLALGIDPSVRPLEQRVPLGSGDVLVISTDGFEECRDVTDEPYGRERLLACVEAHADGAAQALADALLEDTARHSLGAENRRDDRTALVLRGTDRGEA